MKAAQASNTAKVIAASTILLASDPRTSAQVAPGAAALCQILLSGSRADRWLAWRNEPFASALEPEAMQDFLAAHRFSLVEMALTRQFTEPSATRGPLLEGENMVVCEPVLV